MSIRMLLLLSSLKHAHYTAFLWLLDLLSGGSAVLNLMKWRTSCILFVHEHVKLLQLRSLRGCKFLSSRHVHWLLVKHIRVHLISRRCKWWLAGLLLRSGRNASVDSDRFVGRTTCESGALALCGAQVAYRIDGTVLGAALECGVELEFVAGLLLIRGLGPYFNNAITATWVEKLLGFVCL